MEHYKIEAISDILTRSDLGNTRADFADLVEQFEALKTARNEQAAQFESDLARAIRAEAFALFDSVPYFSDWIAERVQNLELSNIEQSYISESYIAQIAKESFAGCLSESEFVSIINNCLDENINLEEMISDRVDYGELVLNNVDCAELVSNHVDFDELVSNHVDFDELASKSAITAVDDYVRELSISIRID